MRWMLVLTFAVMFAGCGSNNEAQRQPAASNAPVGNGPTKSNTAPEPNPEPDPKRDTASQRDAEYVSFEGGLRVYPAKRQVEMDAVMLSEQTRPLEFLVVSPGGATHEALFATSARGEHLKRGLEIVGLSESTEKRTGRGYFEKPKGDRVKISVRFKHADTGEQTTVRVEEWLTDFRLKEKPEPVGWVFTGSFEQYKPDLNRSIFEADLKGNIVALWRDSSCVLDNDRESGMHSDVYSPNPNAPGIPRAERGQPARVVLIFEPHE